MKTDFDVDMDFRTDFDPTKIFTQAVRASRVHEGQLVKHQVGIYLQGMSQDPLSGLAAIPYDVADDEGFIKIDMLHLSLLNGFTDKREIRQLILEEPDWKLLTDRQVVERLFQLKRHFDVVNKIKPKTVQELADAIAIIRPGKRYLLDAYVKDREFIRKELYRKPDDPNVNYFKKSHAVAYSLNVVLQLHLIGREQLASNK